MEIFTTHDGRGVEYLEVGHPDGRPVVYLHGTPGTGGSVALLQDAARRNGVRLVAVSRPGYGDSTTTAPGLLAVARDIDELTGELGIDEFAVLGASGGGPYALAAATAMSERVARVFVAAGVGPVHVIAPQMLEPDDVRALELLASGDVDGAVALVTAEAHRDFGELRQLSGDEFARAFAGMGPPSEHYFDSRPDERARFASDFHRAIQRYDGFVRDNLSWLGPWDFDLDDVVAPVHLFYGEGDVMSPAVHGEWLAARLPRATLHLLPGAGHGEITFGSADEMFALLDRTG